MLVQIDPRSSPAYYLKAALILTTLAAAYYGTFFLFQNFAVRCSSGAATSHRFISSVPLLSIISSPSLRSHAPESSKCPCGTITHLALLSICDHKSRSSVPHYAHSLPGCKIGV